MMNFHRAIAAHVSRLPGWWQSTGDEITQDDPHGYERTTVPWLRVFFSVLALGLIISRDRRPERGQVGFRMARQLTRHAEGDEIDEGALAAAGVAEQGQVGLGIEHG